MNETLQKWITEKQQGNKAENTLLTWKSNLRQYNQWLEETGQEFPTEGDDLQQTHAELIHDFLREEKDKGYRRETVKNRYKTLKALYNDLASHFKFGYFEESPFEIIEDRSDYLPPRDHREEKRRRVYVTKEEKEQLKENVESPRFRNELIIEIMWQCGFRQGEVLTIQIDNIDLENNRFVDVARPKVGDFHTVSFNNSLSRNLKQFMDIERRTFYYAEESDYLFPTNKAEKPGRQLPNRVIKEAAENAGIQWQLGEDMNGNTRWAITSHALRRGHGMYLWENDVDLHTIRQRLGHESIEQTEDYLPITNDHVEEKIAGIDW